MFRPSASASTLCPYSLLTSAYIYTPPRLSTDLHVPVRPAPSPSMSAIFHRPLAPLSLLVLLCVPVSSFPAIHTPYSTSLALNAHSSICTSFPLCIAPSVPHHFRFRAYRPRPVTGVLPFCTYRPSLPGGGQFFSKFGLYS